jgi:hypothetical protein
MSPPDPPELPQAACEICERRPGAAVQDALTRALLIDRPAAGALVAAHGWTMRIGSATGGATTFRCPEHTA